MTTGHKLMIGTGAVIIVGLLLVAAFCLGVYVGEYGWTREGLALQRPGNQQARPPDGAPSSPGGQPPLPGGGRPPDVTGRIRDVIENRLILATPDGPRTVVLNEETRVEDHEGALHPLDALERGRVVAVFGYRSRDGRVLIAGTVILLPPPE